jgi:hypothetical protein
LILDVSASKNLNLSRGGHKAVYKMDGKTLYDLIMIKLLISVTLCQVFARIRTIFRCATKVSVCLGRSSGSPQ